MPAFVSCIIGVDGGLHLLKRAENSQSVVKNRYPQGAYRGPLSPKPIIDD